MTCTGMQNAPLDAQSDCSDILSSSVGPKSCETSDDAVPEDCYAALSPEMQ